MGKKLSRFSAACAGLCFAGAVAYAQTEPVGFWEFENSGDLTSATVGNDLTTSGSGFTAIQGVDASDGAVTVGVGSYYSLAHGIAANGGGSNVNEYSLLIDFQVPSINQWTAFYQTDLSNTNDGELFVQENTGRLGVGDLNYSILAISANSWHRMLVTFEVTGGNIEYTLYVDGSEEHDATLPAGGFLDQRFSLDSSVLLFADENAEDNPIDVTNVAIFDQAVTPAHAAALGSAGDPVLGTDPGPGPGPGPIPTVPTGAPLGGLGGLAALATALAAAGAARARRKHS